MVSPSAMIEKLHTPHFTLHTERGTDGNGFSDKGREILAQVKDLQPQEYFVYFKAGNLKNWGKRSGIC